MGVKIERRIFFGQMNDKVNTNIMDSFNNNTNLNIGIEMYKKFIIVRIKKIHYTYILSHRLVLNDGKIS